jgi:hypothetical protein
MSYVFIIPKKASDMVISAFIKLITKFRLKSLV